METIVKNTIAKSYQLFPPNKTKLHGNNIRNAWLQLIRFGFGLWFVTPLSTIFQLYRSGGGNQSTRRKPPTFS